MSKNQNLFVRSLHELKNTRCLAVTALLIAINVTIVGGLIWGLWLYPRKITVWRAIGAKACINLFCNIGLNTLWLTITGGKAMSVLLVTRVPKNLILLPIEVVLTFVVMKIVKRVYESLPQRADMPVSQKTK